MQCREFCLVPIPLDAHCATYVSLMNWSARTCFVSQLTTWHFFSLQKLKRSRKVCSMRRDIAWRHLRNEKGWYAVALTGLGVNFCHVVQYFIYGCACLNIADIRWRKWVCRDQLRLPFTLRIRVSDIDRLSSCNNDISGIACFKLKAFCCTSSRHMNWDWSWHS